LAILNQSISEDDIGMSAVSRFEYPLRETLNNLL